MLQSRGASLMAFLWVGSLLFPQTPTLAPDAVYYNAKVLTVDSSFRIVEATCLRISRAV